MGMMPSLEERVEKLEKMLAESYPTARNLVTIQSISELWWIGNSTQEMLAEAFNRYKNKDTINGD